MIRFGALLLVLALVAASCSGEDVDPGSQSPTEFRSFAAGLSERNPEKSAAVAAFLNPMTDAEIIDMAAAHCGEIREIDAAGALRADASDAEDAFVRRVAADVGLAPEVMDTIVGTSWFVFCQDVFFIGLKTAPRESATPVSDQSIAWLAAQILFKTPPFQQGTEESVTGVANALCDVVEGAEGSLELWSAGVITSLAASNVTWIEEFGLEGVSYDMGVAMSMSRCSEAFQALR